MRMGSAGVALDASPASSATITASTRTLLGLDIVGLPGVAATVPWPTGVDKPGDAADCSAHVASLVLGDMGAWPVTRPSAQHASPVAVQIDGDDIGDRKSTRLNSSHGYISYAVFCLKKKKQRSR